MTQWETMIVRGSTNQMADFQNEANRLGALGWEPIAITGLDKTIGLNALVLLLKRPIANPPPIPVTHDQWQPDPTGRWPWRRWTFRGWGAEVRSEKAGGIDPPDMYPDQPPG